MNARAVLFLQSPAEKDTSHKATSDGVYLFNPHSCDFPNPGSFGTYRRNQLFGPGFSNVDLAVVKTTQVTERVHAQLRAELFNAQIALKLIF